MSASLFRGRRARFARPVTLFGPKVCVIADGRPVRVHASEIARLAATRSGFVALRKQYVRYFTCSRRGALSRTRREEGSSALGYIRPDNRYAGPGDAGSRPGGRKRPSGVAALLPSDLMRLT